MSESQRALLRIEAAKKRFASRRVKMRQIKAIREGNWREVAGDIFPYDIPEPMVANFIDIAAQASAEDIAPLPTFSCTNPKMNTDAARKSADKRTKIVNYYVQHSRLGEHHTQFADRLNTYGFAAYGVEPDFEAKMPCIYIRDSIDALYDLNPKGETMWYAECFRKEVTQLAYEFPDQLMHRLEELESTHDLEVVRYWDTEVQLLIIPQLGLELSRIENSVKGRCEIRVVERPKLGDTPRGAYDDLPWVQLARAMMSIYTLRIAERVANAPTVVPRDVQHFETGADAIIQSDNPQHIHAVNLSVPSEPFVELQNLAAELRTGARHSEIQDGSTDASIITGKGVEALMGGYNTRIKTLQGKIASGLTDVTAICLEMDEALWPDLEKSVAGREAGAPFELKYKPSRDINGDYTCAVSYGLTAGLDPNRSLVFILQAEAGGLISKDTARRELPFDIEAEAERDRIIVEQLRDGLLGGVMALPQTLAPMAMQGADPSDMVMKAAKLIELVQKGSSIEDAVLKAFAPPPPQEAAPEDVAAAGGAQPEDPMSPNGAMGAMSPNGGGGDPMQDLLMSLAGTTGSGAPNLAMSVNRKQPV